MVSVRQTALIWMTVLLTLVGLVGAGMAYLVDLAQANLLLDSQLQQIAMNAGPGAASHAPAARRNPNDDILVQIWEGNGDRVHSSDPKADLPRQSEAGFATLEAASGAWRSFQTINGDLVVQASQRWSVRTKLARTAAIEAATPILITIPLGWLVVGWGLQRVLSRLGTLAAVIAERSVDAKQPIAVDQIPIEVGPLVAAMNLLIGRLQKSIDQQKQFVSDAAHELRTPLAALRLQIDNLLIDRNEEAMNATLPELKSGVGRTSALVDQLLRLARYDAVASAPERRDLDLVELVLACLADHVQVAESKRVDLGLVSSDPGRFVGSERDVQVLVGNLIENAVRYTPPGGVVDVAVRLRGERAEIEVADTGCGIKEELLPRVFDRFFRAVPPDTEGTGLGLAICKAIADRHGLSITLRNRDTGGLSATVSGRHPGLKGRAPADQGPASRVPA